jgi:hypothetical protein
MHACNVHSWPPWGWQIVWSSSSGPFYSLHDSAPTVQKTHSTTKRGGPICQCKYVCMEGINNCMGRLQMTYFCKRSHAHMLNHACKKKNIYACKEYTDLVIGMHILIEFNLLAMDLLLIIYISLVDPVNNFFQDIAYYYSI